MTYRLKQLPGSTYPRYPGRLSLIHIYGEFPSKYKAQIKYVTRRCNKLDDQQAVEIVKKGIGEPRSGKIKFSDVRNDIRKYLPKNLLTDIQKKEYIIEALKYYNAHNNVI